VTAFATSVDRLIHLVAHWEQARWWTRPAGPAGSVPPTRADLAYGLVQRLADLTADAESRPHRPVPRLGDVSLPDQLRVMADDLLAAEPDKAVLRQAVDDVESLRHAM
jgi:hypothetical protein